MEEEVIEAGARIREILGTQDRILRQGSNCWRIEKARRAAFLIDAECYFLAFRSALKSARRSILIAGWDINSRVKLVRESPSDGLPATLADFLNALLRRRPELEIHILLWDYMMVYALDREWLAMSKLGWGAHHRLHIHMDGDHPMEASHHQKIVVVDDEIGFAGGMDICKDRWDTSAHHLGDPRRRNPEGEPFPPRHDVQMAVTGDAAAALGDLIRERWRRSAGSVLPAPERSETGESWPLETSPDMENVEVGIARTEPAYKGRPEVREAERLYRDSIAAARRFIYFEHQYLTSRIVAEAVAARLEEPDGPEVVFVLQLQAREWLEQQTMDTLRTRIFRRLRKADRNGRLRFYYPSVLGDRREPIYVHSKVTIADDDFARVGSSNLSNRSMGVDTECDLAIEAAGNESARQAISGFLSRLLGEHLGVEPDAFAEAMAREGSLIGAIESLKGGRRSLEPIEIHALRTPEPLAPEFDLLDSDRPIDPDRVTDRFLSRDGRKSAYRRLAVPIAVLVVLLALAAAWRWTPLREWLDVRDIVGRIAQFRDTAAAPFLVVGGYVVAGLLVVPVTVCIVATVLAFGPVLGFVYSLIGALLSALVTYAVGRVIGRDTVSRLGGSRVGRAVRRLSNGGALTLAAVRMIPVAPFTLINVVAGTIRFPLPSYAAGTVAGMVPGMIGLTILTDRLRAAILNPDPKTFLWFGVVSVAVALLLLGVRAWLGRR